MTDIIDTIRRLSHTKTREEIREKLNLKYSTLTHYLRTNNITPKKTKKIFGGGRPFGSYDKKKRKPRHITGGSARTQTTFNLDIDGGNADNSNSRVDSVINDSSNNVVNLSRRDDYFKNLITQINEI